MRHASKSFVIILSLKALALFPASAQQAAATARAVTDPGVITTRQSITPAGVPTIFNGRVYAAEFSRDGAGLWVLGATYLYQLDWSGNRILASWRLAGRPVPQGMTVDPETGAVYLPLVVREGNSVGLYRASGGRLELVAGALGTFSAGKPAIAAGRVLVPLTKENRLAVIEAASGKVLGIVPTGIAPSSAAAAKNGETAYVSNWGGEAGKPGEAAAPTGLSPDADRVAVDARGLTASGTVTRVDLKSMRATHTIRTGLHPTSLAWDEAAGRLYAAASNGDEISVIDTKMQQPLAPLPVQPFQRNVKGIAPGALALAPDGKRLYAACGGINAVAVFDAPARRLLGMIPAAWYPASLALSASADRLAMGALLGPGSAWRDEPRKRYVHANRGAVHIAGIPDAAQLASYTSAVAENTHLPLAGTPLKAAPRETQPRVVPARAGDASLIEHVVYIVKENRTYDQVFGDIAKGNGDPSLVMYGENITPNQHKLASEFVLLDNFYATGGNSADGHQWVTQANETAYCLWPGYAGRSYPFDGTDPLAYSNGGFLWDLALAAKRTVRIYGEYAGRMPEPENRQRVDLLERWKKGEDFSSQWTVTAPIEPLNKILARNYPSYTNAIPDVIRADIFLKDLAAWEKSGTMPNLSILLLPSDHTYGKTPNVSSPRAMVADNDYAVGKIVEGLSKSRFWPKMTIFIVEDDAQDGVDHVDGHRTVALAISPYTRRGAVDSTFYSHQSMVKTIELMLGLPTMSLFDLIANDMRASFHEKADLTPFTAVAPTQDLFEVNPDVRALRGKAREAARASARFRWDVPDAAPPARLNRILWGDAKGWEAPYPRSRRAVFAPLALEDADDE